MEEESKRTSLVDLIKNRIDGDTFEGKYNSSIRKRILFIFALFVISFIAITLGICLGSVDIPFLDVLRSFFHPILPDIIPEPSMWYYSKYIFEGRMPRAVLVIFTGFSLGISGMVMQGLLRNPLVSPFTLGVSTAASFGAAMAIVIGSLILGSSVDIYITLLNSQLSFEDILMIVFAFATSMCSVGIILILGRGKNVSRSSVILCGVVISYLFQAGIMAAKYFSDDDQLREITLWIMGSMNRASWGTDLILLPIIIISSILLFKMSMDLNALSAGDDLAQSLGVNVEKLRRNGMIICTLLTSACLAFTGVIGFIGLMAPHLSRMIIGNDSRYLLPASGLMGITILSISDLFCRMVIRPGELPVSIVLYIVGGIFFIWMIANRKWSNKL
ncbi:MAG: iron ABC transporter permease [Candidatus Methanomethylophilaceae archaeon]|nr:iron ABC transporter permease [Candidatus Methanomethylophilaceae archaeon]